jgi:hypothetical protein
MFYKYNDENNTWSRGNAIHFPDGTLLSKDNKIEKDGWFYSEEEPIEYIEWLINKEYE